MSQPEAPPPQPAGRLQPQPPMAAPLYKQKSWSPDLYRDEAWLRRKGSQSHRRHRRSKTVTDDDLDELKACIELGFGFGLGLESPDTDKHLSDTLPALGLYYAVNKQYYGSFSSSASDSDASSPLGSPQTTIFNSDGEDKVEAMGTSGCLFGASIVNRLMIMILDDPVEEEG
ncbi:hypothetical protein RJ639_006819 [Escallonia herrerae]|uniref:Uncharacterized protein n=1 Tax=Escallonia herrerae TaxID=1293975 RepID=A0AA88VWR7_9ASTE|nr:hypothetical protein RJ639_006819 [Escallonia herrerae]